VSEEMKSWSQEAHYCRYS